MYLDRRNVLAGLLGSVGVAGCTNPATGRPISALKPNVRPARMIPYDQFEARRRIVQTSFGKIAYTEYGEGSPALFLHGLALNSYFWTGQLTGLSAARRCIAIDLMAHGHSEISQTQDVSFTAQADMAWAVLDALNIDEADLVGSDSGGAIAQIMAVKQPKRTSSLVLTNCDVHDNWPPNALKAIRASAPDGLAENFAQIVEHPELVRSPQGLAPLVFANPDIASDAFVDIFLGPLTRTARQRGAFNRYAAPQDPTQLTRIEADLKQLDAPALILWGTDDIFFPLPWAYWLEATLPNAQPVIEFEGEKLFFPFERPDAVNAEILKFWNGL